MSANLNILAVLNIVNSNNHEYAQYRTGLVLSRPAKISVFGVDTDTEYQIDASLVAMIIVSCH